MRSLRKRHPLCSVRPWTRGVPRRRHELPRRRLELPARRLELPVRRLELPARRLELPARRLESNYPHGDLCPSSAPCASELPSERPAARYLKNGTTKILDAGVNTARALDKHRLVPIAIHDTLCLSHQREIHVTSQHATARHYSDIFVEWCYHPQSNLAEIAEKQNFIVMRYDNSSKELDASSPQTVSRVIGILRNHLNSGRRMLVWCSLPCTPWSTWQRLRPNTVKPQSELSRMRNESNSLMTHFLALVRAIRGPRATIAFEWPRFCDGWNSYMLPLITKLIRLLPYRANIDGCMHHVKSSDGSPILRPWRIQCTNPNLASLLTVHCDSHFHVPCAGADTAKTFTRGAWPVPLSVSILHVSGSIMSQLMS